MIDLAGLRQHALRVVNTAEPEQLADVVGVLEAVKSVAVAKLATPAPPPPIARLATAEELEAAHQVPASWFRDAARRGDIPSVRHGAYVRFDAEAVRSALANQPALRRRGRADHRISQTAPPKTASKNGRTNVAATTPLPPQTEAHDGK